MKLSVLSKSWRKKFKVTSLLVRYWVEEIQFFFKNMENPIINDKWYGEKKTNEEDEAKRIIEMKGKRTKNNIKQFPSSKCLPKFTYPSRKRRKLIEFLITLRFFLSLLIHSEIKVENIGKCLMKAALRESLCHLCCLQSKSTVCLLQSD